MMGGQDRAWLETLAVGQGAAGGLPRSLRSVLCSVFSRVVSISCGVLKLVPCTLIPYTLESIWGDIRLPLW